MNENPSPYIVGPVDRALRVLQCLADEGRELTLTELTYKTRLPKSSVFRYLATLRHWGLVSHDPATELYRLGMKLRSLARRVGNETGIRDAAVPVMRQLRDRFNETINLGELEGGEVVYLEIVESRRSLRMQAVIGARDPAHATALGKAILSKLPEECWDDHLPRTLAARTRSTQVSRDRLVGELRAARAAGWATDHGENEDGAYCVASPILAGDIPLAALSLSAPTSRITQALAPQMAEAIREAANRITERLRQTHHGEG